MALYHKQVLLLLQAEKKNSLANWLLEYQAGVLAVGVMVAKLSVLLCFAELLALTNNVTPKTSQSLRSSYNLLRKIMDAQLSDGQ